MVRRARQHDAHHQHRGRTRAIPHRPVPPTTANDGGRARTVSKARFSACVLRGSLQAGAYRAMISQHCHNQVGVDDGWQAVPGYEAFSPPLPVERASDGASPRRQRSRRTGDADTSRRSVTGAKPSTGEARSTGRYEKAQGGSRTDWNVDRPASVQLRHARDPENCASLPGGVLPAGVRSRRY
jgi:hypothetical protein